MKEAESSADAFGSALERIGELGAKFFGIRQVEDVLDRVKEAFVEATTGTAEWAEKLENTAIATGISVQHLQGLQFAAQATGTSMERLTQFSTQLARKLEELRSGSGSKSFASVLEQSGLHPKDLEDTYTALVKIGDAINRLGPGSEQARELMGALGARGVAQLAPTLVQLDRLNSQFQQLGITIDDDGIHKSEEFAQSLHTLGAVWSGVLHQVGVTLAPVLTATLQVFDAVFSTVVGIVEAGWQTIKVVFANIEDLALLTGRTIKDALTGNLAGIQAAWQEYQDRGRADNRAYINSLISDWEEYEKRVGALVNAGNIPEIKITEGAGKSPLLGGGAKPSQIFEQYRAELALEEAEAGKDADKKILIAQAFVEKIRRIQGLPLKDLISAYAEEERAYQAYLATKQQMALKEVADEQTIAKGQLALDQAQVKQQFATLTQAATERLALGQETHEEELADQIRIGEQKLAQDTRLENLRNTNLQSALAQRLVILSNSGLYDLEAMQTVEAQIQGNELEHQAKLTEIITAAAAQRATLMKQLAQEQMTEIAGDVTSVLEPISRTFDQSFTGVIQGTQTVSRAFRKMAADILLSLARSGIQDLLLGGAKDTIGASIFGEQGKGGGIAGAIASAFGGPAVTGALTSALGGAFRQVQSVIAQVFGGAFQAIGSVLKSVFSTAVGGLTGGAASGLTRADLNSSLAPLLLTGKLQLLQMVTHTGIAAAHLATAIAHMGVTVAHLAQSLIHTVYLALIAAFQAVKAIPVVGELFEQGGIVSAAGGMTVPGGFGGRPAILHPREMVLPADLSEGIQRMIRGGGGDEGGAPTGGGGGDTHIHNYGDVNASAIDSRGVAQLLKQHQSTIAQLVIDHVSRRGGRLGLGVA